ncbi:MAG: selenocysteine-specific translation elongation factor [Gemmatimonadota bacterium]
MIVGTAGHIDHGKTTLVRALTGVDTDRLPEEKRRGITIELGFAPLRLSDSVTVGIVDVPGHEGLVRTMLAGATGIDIGLLVVAADEGPMPQTKEHLSILTLLAVPRVVVALTRIDLVEVEWLELVQQEIAGMLVAAGYRGAPVVPVSPVTGEGIDSLRASMVAALASSPERRASDVLRLPVDRAFTVKGTGVVVTGTIWSGTVAGDSSLQLFPGGRPVRVRTLHSFGGAVASAGAGMRAAVGLAGVDLNEVGRGRWLVEESGWMESGVLHAEVRLLEGVRTLRPREWVRLHLATCEVGARVVARLDAMPGGMTGLARVILDEPIVARAGDRFVLRRGSPPETIGGGIVTDPAPLQRRSRPLFGSAASNEERIGKLSAAAGAAGIDVRTLPVRVGPDATAALPGAIAAGDVQVINDRIVATSVLADGAQRILDVLTRESAANPFEEGIARARVVSSSGLDDELFSAILDAMVGEGRLVVRDGLLSLPGQRAVTAAMEADRRTIATLLEEAGVEPPSTDELRATLGKDPYPILRSLERDGRVVQVEPIRFYSSRALEEALERLRKGMKPGTEYGPGELRDLVGTSRKFLIPFLEYCDRRRFTERRGGGRVLSGAAKAGTAIA